MEHYFLNCHTVFEIKARFRELAMIHHPDRGGDNETMRIVLEQYQEALKAVDGQTSFDEAGKEHTYYYNEANEAAIAEKLQELLALKMKDVTIALIGTWIWVAGETKPHAEKLGRKKGLGLSWHSKKSMWYWKPYRSYTPSNGNTSIGSIAQKYGYKEFRNQDDNAIV